MADIILKNVPEDVRKIILTEQLKEKQNRGTNQFSISTTLFKIVREWERCYNSQKQKP